MAGGFRSTGVLGNIVDQGGEPLSATQPEMFSPTRIRSVLSSFSPFQDTRRMYFRSRSIRNNAQQRPCKTECGGGDDVDQLVEIERGARLSLTAWRNISCSIFLLGLLVQSRVLDDDAGLARKGREHLDVRLGEDEFLRSGIALQDPDDLALDLQRHGNAGGGARSGPS